jgi:hypothetical protein
MESADVAEIKRHFNVVAEGLEKKIQLVAEKRGESGVSLAKWCCCGQLPEREVAFVERWSASSVSWWHAPARHGCRVLHDAGGRRSLR